MSESESDSGGENNIEKIEDKYILDGIVNYIVKYKNMRTFMSVTFDQLNKSEQKFIKKYEKLLNIKREKPSNNADKYDSIIPQNKNRKYKNDEESFVPQNKIGKYKNDKESFIPQNKKRKYENDEDSFTPQNKKRKYKNDEESFIPQNKKMKYNNDEESENNQSLSHHQNENKYNNKNKEYNNNNKENKKINQRHNSFDYNFGDNNDNNDFSMSSKYERDGTFLSDSPSKILNVGTKNRNDKNLYGLVRWKQNKDIKILDSVIDIKIIKKACPDLLIDFYESKIIFNQYLDD